MAREASVLVLDGFATAQRAAADAQGFNEFVHELQGVAIATDCTMFLLTSAEGTRNTPEYTIVDGIVELSDQLFGWSAESALQVIKLRGSDHLRGKHAFRITDDGLVVYPRIEALLAKPSRPDRGGTEKVSSGVDRLDAMLGGGLPAASTTLIMGPSGVGKTTFGLQFLSKCSEAEPGLLFGFYETPARIMVKADGVCRPLRGLIEAARWRCSGSRRPTACSTPMASACSTRSAAGACGGCSSTAWAPSATPRASPRASSHFLTALTNELRVLGVTTAYTMEVADIIGPTIRAPISDLSSVAENLILLRFIELRSRLYRLISILKVRDSDFDPSLHQYITTGRGPGDRGRPPRAPRRSWPASRAGRTASLSRTTAETPPRLGG